MVNSSNNSGKLVAYLTHGGRILNLVAFQHLRSDYQDLAEKHDVTFREEPGTATAVSFDASIDNLISYLLAVAARKGQAEERYFAVNPNSELTPHKQLAAQTQP
ncbi:MAG: hypothetical protein ACPGQM_11735 [Alphaproteobacteria bacterium]